MILAVTAGLTGCGSAVEGYTVEGDTGEVSVVTDEPFASVFATMEYAPDEAVEGTSTVCAGAAPAEEGDTASTAEENRKWRTILEDVSLFSSPENGRVTMVVPKDSKVDVLTEKENGWYKIRYHGSVGYVKSGYFVEDWEAEQAERAKREEEERQRKEEAARKKAEEAARKKAEAEKKKKEEEARKKAEAEKKKKEEEAKKKAAEEKKKKEEAAKKKAEEEKKKKEEEARKKAEAEQAKRDALLAFKTEIQGEFEKILTADVRKELSGEGLGKLIRAAIAGENVADYAAEVSEVSEVLKKELAEEIKNGLEIRPTKGVQQGFRLAAKDGSGYFDCSDDGIMEMLMPYFRELDFQ